MNNKDLKYLVALTHFPKFGPVRMEKIKRYFPLWENGFRAPARELTRAGIEENIAEEFAAARSGINPDAIMEKLQKENIKTAVIDGELYPEPLKEIYGPPVLIYYRGQLPEREAFNLAVVGSRNYSSYGRMAVERIVDDLAKNGLTIVSGLALGIDALAHNAALKAGGRTMAVLGSGLDKQSIYPSSNRYLADKIIGYGGAVISEFPVGSPPLKHHFPQRNRVISGLSLGTLIIEASEKSGSLITARFALEQNREVFAVPGSIYSPNSDGANGLIKQGARAVTGADDWQRTLNHAVEALRDPGWFRRCAYQGRLV